MPKKQPPTDEEISLFRQEMSDVVPLLQNKVTPKKARRKPVPIKTLESERQVILDMMSDEYLHVDLESGEELFFARPGLQHKILRKLRRGQFQLTAELDLHGLNVEAARSALHQFLVDCIDENRKCVRVIHGKGLSSRHKGPVLKQMVNRWLRQRKEVLAFCSSIPAHGGTGAIYLLLRKG